MAPHSSTLAWKIPWTEEPGGLQSIGLLRVRHRHDWATLLSLFTFMHWRRKWQPTPMFLPGESQGRGKPGGLPSMGSHRVGHDWSDLAAAAYINEGFPGGSSGKESACNVGDPSSIPGSGRSPRNLGVIGYPLQYSCLGNPHGQRSLVGCSPWGHKESDTIQQLIIAQHIHQWNHHNMCHKHNPSSAKVFSHLLSLLLLRTLNTVSTSTLLANF